mmetsp:Transcript_37572/g.33642  ORF Transcript_37572/g.33642 Transcript_37572/m.33642 type:complete len:119 (-) Transcript_37572:524-880(-)|eukprot:CAMPEP_0114584708 /NCGR_PEP_ID=MMETSP0125-20121206/8361_1 /TAXON_ID=485358 ORGANISM="Aristerostoma sp., Strain ATCC 50986" /NCGR_SAMPLE_ID=MMETSP0125 /ASSEMBLY_ACC=CAM_ASM_000245 /LENGTH=118 /DNA_ID=CAMNT_0001779275 /DNA_START=434 /DNA_END=790 /DNA_ORIENTATION=-
MRDVYEQFTFSEDVHINNSNTTSDNFNFEEEAKESTDFSPQPYEKSQDSSSAKKKSSSEKKKRAKERTVGEVVDCVLRWRKFYAGARDSITGLFFKTSLEDAAQKVGVSKKSLDDYLL